jgi:hypothetical protein
MKTVILLIFCGLLAAAMGGKAVGNYVNEQLAKVDAAVAEIGRR